jgi:rare lipoprotein A (peptidoglycan hydrolase)
MPTLHASNSLGRIERDSIFSRFLLNLFPPIARALSLGVALACASCSPPSAEAQTEKPKPKVETKPPASPKKAHLKKPYSREGNAVWYAVPVDSLAHRRAGKGELTAAHNHLPLGTMVRVTHLKNGKQVIVRITDRGITKRNATIDLCKEAAELLGMISEGMARVRMEELPDDKGGASVPDSPSTAAHP